MTGYYDCCEHCDPGDDWHVGQHADNHEHPCLEGCNDEDAQ